MLNGMLQIIIIEHYMIKLNNIVIGHLILYHSKGNQIHQII